jgi:hypothetical protein
VHPSYKYVAKSISMIPGDFSDLMRDQKELIDIPIDYLGIYDINPNKIVPSDDKIKDIQEIFVKIKNESKE